MDLKGLILMDVRPNRFLMKVLLIISFIIPVLFVLFERNTASFGLFSDVWVYHGGNEALSSGAELFLINNFSRITFRVDLYFRDVVYSGIIIYGGWLIFELAKNKWMRR